jgi:predicted DNA-binding WGR domain protein
VFVIEVFVIGPNGQELVEDFTDEIEARNAPEAVARATRRRGYRDLLPIVLLLL